MGRTKHKKQPRPKVAEPAAKNESPSKQPSVASLLEKAQSLIVQCDYDLALKFARRVLEQDPKNAEAKEMLGVSLLELGEIEEAKLVGI